MDVRRRVFWLISMLIAVRGRPPTSLERPSDRARGGHDVLSLRAAAHAAHDGNLYGDRARTCVDVRGVVPAPARCWGRPRTVAVRAPDWAHDGHEARVCPVADVHAAGVRHVDEGSALGGSVEAALSVEAWMYARTPAARGVPVSLGAGATRWGRHQAVDVNIRRWADTDPAASGLPQPTPGRPTTVVLTPGRMSTSERRAPGRTPSLANHPANISIDRALPGLSRGARGGGRPACPDQGQRHHPVPPTR